MEWAQIDHSQMDLSPLIPSGRPPKKIILHSTIHGSYPVVAMQGAGASAAPTVVDPLSGPEPTE